MVALFFDVSNECVQNKALRERLPAVLFLFAIESNLVVIS